VIDRCAKPRQSPVRPNPHLRRPPRARVASYRHRPSFAALSRSPQQASRPVSKSDRLTHDLNSCQIAARAAQIRLGTGC